MRAVVLREFGPPDRLLPSTVDEPTLAPGKALIDVAVVNITFVEVQIRAGRPPRASMAPELPVVPGNGVGGVVADVGDGVDREWVGRRVVAPTGGSGAYAERVVVDPAGMVEIPDGISTADAVALLADGRTAMWLMPGAAIKPGETVLVEAAGGGLGTLLVQLARNAGARVVALAGSEQKIALARELGADVAISYAEDGWGERVRAAVGQVDVVFDGVGGAIGETAFTLLRPGGRFCSYGMASGRWPDVSPELAAERGVTLPSGPPLGPGEAQKLTAAALAEAAAGRLRPVIGQSFPLELASEAHAAVESRATLGKTLLIVQAPPPGSGSRQSPSL